MGFGDYIYWHECEEPGCSHQVEFDDEPKCFTHSPDEGSSVRGYSARAKAKKREEDENQKFKMQCEQKHVWTETFPVNHTLFGRCPEQGCNLTGRVLERVD